MNQIRKRLTYANVMSSIAVFLLLGGGAAFAAGKLAKNSVGSKQLKTNSVTAKKIKKNAVTSKKIKNNAVTGAKIKNGAINGTKVADGSLTGADINVGSLPAVPSANTANTANSLAGQTPFFVRLSFGESKPLATNGAVSFVAECLQSGGNDEVRITARTTANGSILAGEDDLEGNSPTDFLNTDTPADQAELVEESVTSGETLVSSEIDQGFVLGPEGKMLSANTEGVALGLNYGSNCLVGGVFNAIG